MWGCNTSFKIEVVLKLILERPIVMQVVTAEVTLGSSVPGHFETTHLESTSTYPHGTTLVIIRCTLLRHNPKLQRIIFHPRCVLFGLSDPTSEISKELLSSSYSACLKKLGTSLFGGLVKHRGTRWVGERQRKFQTNEHGNPKRRKMNTTVDGRNPAPVDR